MIIDLKGRRAAVTGSTAAIGRATAQGLAGAGAAIVIPSLATTYIDPKRYVEHNPLVSGG